MAQRLSLRHEEQFHVGDRVAYHASRGTIIADLTHQEYAPGTARHGWRNVAGGVLVRWDDGTLAHFREPEMTLHHVP